MRDSGRQSKGSGVILSLVAVGLAIALIVTEEIFHYSHSEPMIWMLSIMIMVLIPVIVFIRFIFKHCMPDRDSKMELSEESLRWAEANKKIKGNSMYAIVAGYSRKQVLNSVAVALIVSVLTILLIFLGSARYGLGDTIPAKYKLLTALAIIVVSFIIGGRRDFKQCLTSDFKKAVKDAGIDEYELNRDFMGGTIFPVYQGFINIGSSYISSYRKTSCRVLRMEKIEKAVGYFEDKTINGDHRRFYWLEFRVDNNPVYFRMKDETTMKLIISALVIHGVDAKQLK